MRLAFLFLMCAIGAAAAHAAPKAEPKAAEPQRGSLGTFGVWESFLDLEGGKPVCYMVAKPGKSDGTYKARGEVLLTITQRPSRKELDVVAIIAGYQYKVDSDVAVNVGKESWSFFSRGDRAWARDAATDKAVTRAIVKGGTLTTKGTSIRGTPTTDTFNLNGAAKAYNAITQACKKG